MNNNLMDSTMPLLKTMIKKVKENNQNSKAEYYKIQKELHHVEMEKRNIRLIMVKC